MGASPSVSKQQQGKQGISNPQAKYTKTTSFRQGVKPHQSFASIQYVAFEICTMPNGFQTKCKSDDYYIGLEDCDADLTSRVTVVKNVLDQAIADPSIDPAALKVFMMPEFFFRGRIGAYTLQQILGEDKNAEGSIQEILSSLVLDAKWASWIFVFGTVVGYKSIPKEGQFHYEIYNVAIIQQGGLLTSSEAKKQSVCVMKEHKSGIDFLQSAAFGDLLDSGVRPIENADEVQTIALQGDPDKLQLDTDCIFTMLDVTFGLEVCLDHACKSWCRAVV